MIRVVLRFWLEKYSPETILVPFGGQAQGSAIDIGFSKVPMALSPLSTNLLAKLFPYSVKNNQIP